jgi:hypothetical protein
MVNIKPTIWLEIPDKIYLIYKQRYPSFKLISAETRRADTRVAIHHPTLPLLRVSNKKLYWRECIRLFLNAGRNVSLTWSPFCTRRYAGVRAIPPVLYGLCIEEISPVDTNCKESGRRHPAPHKTDGYNKISANISRPGP